MKLDDHIWRWCKCTIKWSFVLAVIAFLALMFAGWRMFNPVPYDRELSDVEIPKFELLPFTFDHQYDGDNKLPLLGSALFDADNDGLKELFLGGGAGQADGLFTYADGQILDVSERSGLDKDLSLATYGVAALDVTDDGLVDLFVARDDDVYLYTNAGNKQFRVQKLNLPFNEKTTPVSIALTDLNQDGAVDMFVSGYLKKAFVEGYTIFNQEGYGGNSLLFLNNGDNTFTDITESAGLSYTHNTFLGVFVDVDLDQDSDLVVAYDTGQVKTYRRNEDLTFTEMPNPTSGKFAYPMGIAVGDINQDTLPDFFFSNIGFTVPTFMARGDLEDDQELIPEWLMFENQGDFVFKDRAQERELANYEFAWGAAFGDFNLDGREDLVVTESYADFPLHAVFRLPGRFLLQKPDGRFVAAEKEAKVVNRKFGIAPLIGDIDGDGDEDLFHANLNGTSMACLNHGVADQHFFKLILPEKASSLGARATLTLDNGETRTNYFVSGEGLSSDQSHELIFGLRDGETIEKLEIFYEGGRVEIVTEGLEVDGVLRVE